MISLMSGALFIIFGFILRYYPPERINNMYGYRTTMSMKNQDTWDTAQKCGGISLIICGFINIIFGIYISMYSLIIKKDSVQGLFLLLTAIVMIILDEIHLRKIFDNHGKRKDETTNY